MANRNPVTETLADRDEGKLRTDLLAAEVDEHAADQICALLEHAKANGMSLKALSKATRISHGVLSQIFNARYPGNYMLRARKIEQYLMDIEGHALFGGRDDFAQTEIAKSIWAICERTRYSRRIQTLQSPEQLGKSRALSEYERANNGGRTVYVEVKPGCGSNPTALFIRDLAVAARCRYHVKRRLTDVRIDVREALSICDLVIIDEFHLTEHWPDRSVRDLLDYIRTEIFADGKRGVLMVATNADVGELLDAFRKRTKYNLGQLLGRMCNQPLTLSPDDIPEADVRLLVERYYRPGKRALGKLYDIATRPTLGHFGLLLDILNRAWTDCKLDGATLTDDLVLSIARETMEDIATRRRA